ncbi:hypothetical protein LCGC14_2350440 [marine sediment metagenome]|uniref:Uncharacterized protein n=1 Tax=marine sediment metagenome TaxID=412755 RepID=A0A0F9EM25_9ZZZZ
MGADLHIHIVPDEETLKHVKQYLKSDCTIIDKSGTRNVHTRWEYDGKWVGDELFEREDFDVKKVGGRREYTLHFDEDKVDNTPSIWIGEVSWLKAGLFDNAEEYIPKTIGAVAKLFENPIVDVTQEFVKLVQAAFTLEPHHYYGRNEAVKVTRFLSKYIGKKAFTISW